MAINQTGLAGRFDVQKYRREGRLYRTYYKLDLDANDFVDLVFTTPVEILLVTRDIKLVSGSIEYAAYNTSEIIDMGIEQAIIPVDFSLGKPALATFYNNATIGALGSEVDYDLVRTSSQKISTFSVKTQQEASRLYPPGTYHLRIRNNTTDVGTGQGSASVGLIEFEYGERQSTP